MRNTHLHVILILLGLIGISTSSLAQTARILYDSADLLTLTTNAGVDRIINKPINNSLVVRFKDGSTQRIPIKNVWGYIREDGTIFRRYQRDFLEIISQKDSITYKNSLVLYISRGPRILTNYYYSQYLDSPIVKK